MTSMLAVTGTIFDGPVKIWGGGPDDVPMPVAPVVLVALLCTPLGVWGGGGSVERVPDSPHEPSEQLH